MPYRKAPRNQKSGALVKAADSDERRIGKLIEPQPDGCWLFKGEPDEYGRAYIGRKPVTVHRFVYETLVGPIPEGHHLHHECENPGCCNPEHLTALTPSQHPAEHSIRRNPEPKSRDPRDLLADIQRYQRAGRL